MVAALLPVSIAVHSKQLDAVDEVCGAAIGCPEADVLSQVLLLTVFGLLTVFLLATLQRVSEARAEVAEEQSRTATERDAFAAFAQAVAKLDPSPTGYQLAGGDGAAATVAMTGHTPSDDRLEAVRKAYRDTVMAMAHYDEEYAETLASHLREEFGEEVSTAVTNGDRLTPELRQVLVRRAREAANERGRLIDRLDREAEALEAATTELEVVVAAVEDAEDRRLADLDFRALADEWNRLGEFESRLTRLLERRQEALHSQWQSGSHQGLRTLQHYLYVDLDTAVPLLADGAVLANRLDATRSRLLATLTSRV
jgi:type II secretory pathway pseudopilin PulG